jgi:HK97 family phage prohead protease
MPEIAKGPLLEWRKKKVETLKGLERRSFDTSEMELRADDDGTLHLSGYASLTGVSYEVGWYTETIERGAFKRTLSESPDVQLLINHTGMPIARTRSGTLTLAEDDRGLKVDADLDPEDPDVKSLKRKMDRGDIDQMSFAFLPTAQDWNEDYTERKIIACSIHRGDVSVVNMGASESTFAAIRSADAARALGDLGAQVVLAAFREWRNYSLLTLEQRAGKTLSAATMETLTQIANAVAAADDALDEASPLLADLMGVEDPDTDDGEASVERSIDNEKTLCAAIRAVIREPDKDERRVEIVKRAQELEMFEFVPRSWDYENGELRAGYALDTQEKRETYNDTYAALCAALSDVLVDNGDYYYVWVQDFTDTDVIYSAGRELWSAPYTLVPGGEVTIGEGVKVRPVTEYVPRAADPPAETPETPAVRALPDFTTRARAQYDLRVLKDGKR